MEVNIAGMARTVTAKLLKLISGDFNLRRLYSFFEREGKRSPAYAVFLYHQELL